MKNKTKKKMKKSKSDQKVVKPRKDETKAEIMDRGTLKAMASQLQSAGIAIKVMKNDTDEQLQRKVNDALQALPSAEVMKKLETVDPNKLVSVLGRDCIGLFVDFSDVSCVRCADAAGCVTAFIKNVSNPPDLGRAMPDGVAAKSEARSTIPPVTKYDPSRLVFVRDVKNPNPKGDDLHDTIQKVLDDQPDTLGELRKIVELEFDLDSDGDFMKFVTALRDPKEGVLKLDVDLSETNKVELRKAGYDV